MLSLIYKENEGIRRAEEPISIGVPVSRSALRASQELCLVDSKNNRVRNSSVEVVDKWPDQSARWICVKYLANMDPWDELRLFVVEKGESIKAAPIIEDELRPALVDIQYGGTDAFLNFHSKTSETTETDVNNDKERLQASLNLFILDKQGRKLRLDFDWDKQEQVLTSSSTLIDTATAWTSISIDNAYSNLHVHATLNFDRYANLLHVEVSIHNPRAARHPNGLWDLGDEHSMLFDELLVEIMFPLGSSTQYKLTGIDGEKSIDFDVSSGGAIYQMSSGGVNRMSQVHVGADNLLPELSSGFEVIVRDINVHTGSRATPLAIIQSGGMAMSILLEKFWQEFPSSYRFKDKTLSIGLFSGAGEQLIELQAGERKRRSLVLKMTDPEMPSLLAASSLQAPSMYGAALSTCLYMRNIRLSNTFDQQLATLVITPEEFFNKRELIDEYGWRNFGEIFADHENLYHDSSKPLLVSHYNNQYDLIFGFGLQYLRTGESGWFTLMNDLAKHVADIDIYHTDDDRSEFNHGLFWHTNHYEHAFTATHRTFSKANYDPVKPVGSSGGPGLEHCYTTGFLLHYRLTGDKYSADAILELAGWAWRVGGAEITVLGCLRSILSRELGNIKSLAKGHPVVSHIYAFTRGTGNALVAYLDAFELTHDRLWLERAEHIIVNTFHPDDDIEVRDLLNVELRWSYTIFLQAVLRYLDLKEIRCELDVNYTHARTGLIAYLRWMASYEQPYLDCPERLEFPNDTWAAQDIRKHVLLVAGIAYDSDNAEIYLKCAKILETHVCERLRNCDTVHFSRIQAIIMWNIGMSSVLERKQVSPLNDVNIEPLYIATVISELNKACRRFCKALVSVNLAAEIQWLRVRR